MAIRPKKKASVKSSVKFKDFKSKKNPKGGEIVIELVGRPSTGAGELKFGGG